MDIQNIPQALQSKVRLAIICALITGKKNFNEIKNITGATDGNLSSYLSKLEDLEYVIVEKSFVGKKTFTIYTLTDKAKMEFKEYVKLLEKILNQSNN